MRKVDFSLAKIKTQSQSIKLLITANKEIPDHQIVTIAILLHKVNIRISPKKCVNNADDSYRFT